MSKVLDLFRKEVAGMGYNAQVEITDLAWQRDKDNKILIKVRCGVSLEVDREEHVCNVLANFYNDVTTKLKCTVIDYIYIDDSVIYLTKNEDGTQPIVVPIAITYTESVSL